MVELIDGVWDPRKFPPSHDEPQPIFTPPEDSHQPVLIGGTVSYADRGKIVVRVLIKNRSGMYIKNLPVWVHLKQDISGIGASYGFLSIETKPRYVNLKVGEVRGETFFFEDERIKPGFTYIATLYTEFNGKTYSHRIPIKIEYRPCVGTDFRSDRTEKVDVTSFVRRFKPEVKTAILYIFRGTAVVTKAKPPAGKALYDAWKRGYTVEKKICPLDGKEYYVQYNVKLVEYIAKPVPVEPVKTAEEEPKKEAEKDSTLLYVVAGLGIAAAVIYLLRRWK